MGRYVPQSRNRLDSGKKGYSRYELNGELAEIIFLSRNRVDRGQEPSFKVGTEWTVGWNNFKCITRLDRWKKRYFKVKTEWAVGGNGPSKLEASGHWAEMVNQRTLGTVDQNCPLLHHDCLPSESKLSLVTLSELSTCWCNHTAWHTPWYTSSLVVNQCALFLKIHTPCLVTTDGSSASRPYKQFKEASCFMPPAADRSARFSPQ